MSVWVLRFFAMLFLTVSFVACQSDNTREHSHSTASDKETADVESSQLDAAAEAKHSNPEVSPVFFYMDDVEASQGETVCLDVKVKNFKQIESNQYSVNWNPKELEFVGIKNIELEAMSQNNFGLTRTAEGNFAVSWFDPTLKGVSLSDGSSIYQMCFVVKAPSGTTCSIKFSGEPVAIEFSGTDGKSQDFFIVGFSSRRAHVKVK